MVIKNYKKDNKVLLNSAPAMFKLASTEKANREAETCTIEGFANKRVVDRGNDIIEVDAWELDNYKKNPVILYNHGMDPQLGGTPIGKAVEIRPTKDGLFVKVEISNVDDPVINRIRGLIKERILRAFSVGFDPKLTDKDSETNANSIKLAELFEISVVGVPMNQDSLFNITGKMLSTKSIAAIKSTILQKKGAVVQIEINKKIAELRKCKSDEDIMKSLIKHTNLNENDVREHLNANIEMTSEQLEGFCKSLEMDYKKMSAMLTKQMEGEEDEGNGENDPEQKQADQNIEKNDSAIGSANSDADNNDFGNPMLEQMKQTNVLLGALINQMQLLNQKFDVPPKTQETPPEDVAQGSEEEKGQGVEDNGEDDEEEDPEATMKSRKAAIKETIDNYAIKLENIQKKLEAKDQE